jgi:hypothetical protein
VIYLLFINEEITHLELIKRSIGGKYYHFLGYIDTDEFKEISFDDIDGKSLPTKDSFFKKDLM